MRLLKQHTNVLLRWLMMEVSGGRERARLINVDWEACSKPLLAAYKKIAALPLSTFGRGIAA